MDPVVKSGQSRVWTFDGGVGPFVDPVYQGCMKAGDPSQGQGDVTSIRCPDPNQYNKFVTIDESQAAQERVTLSLQRRYPLALSDLMDMAKRRCRVDMQLAIGTCRNPQDYNGGWDKLIHFNRGKLTTYGAENIGALSDDENNPTNENTDLSAADWYEIVKLAFGRVATAQAAREIATVNICDTPACGECGVPSSGYSRVFATMAGAGATPGTKPSCLYSSDSGLTWGSSTLTTFFSNEPPADASCVGENFVVISTVSISLHYALLDSIVAGVAVWSEVNTGFVAAGAPNAIWSVDPRTTWICGNGGYIYFTADPTAGVTVQSAGTATTQNLLDIEAFDQNVAVAVGNNNAVVFTVNGGDTWTAVTGPAVGISLRCVCVLNASTWLVGTADGRVFKTRDYGTTWTQVGLPSQSSITLITDIEFSTEAVGYIAVRQGLIGSILRTTSGGARWYFLPEPGKAALPVADYYNDIATTPNNPNLVYAGGLYDDATTGIIVKGIGE